MTSPVSKRLKPLTKFDDYVVNFRSNTDEGLINVSDDQMFYVPGSAGGGGLYYKTSIVNIGFSFTFNEVNYARAIVSTNGWLLLLDPTVAVTDFSSVYADISTSNISGVAFVNTTALLPYIASNSSSVYRLLDNFTNEHVLLAPWWMFSKNAYRRFEGPAAPSTLTDAGAIASLYVTNAQAEKIKDGSVDPEDFLGYSPDLGGIKYYNGQNNFGRFFVVRWKSFLGGQHYNDVATFETVLYENGTIEYRYGQKRGFKPRPFTVYNVPTAAVGIFLGEKNFRDFSIFLNTQQKRTDNTDRVLNPNGGCSYDQLFLDQKLYSSTPDFYQSKPYFHNLKSLTMWPGQENFGAKITISPNRNLRKQNKSIIKLRNSSAFVETVNSSFDDRKTIYFNQQSVDYPSMLPTSFKVSHGNKNPLTYLDFFKSGSIQISRTANKLFDSALRDSIVENTSKFDSISPFSEKNIFTLGRESEDFFANGSTISLGEKVGTFSNNLSSKNQIKFNFRVKNPTTMLSNTSSIYYFDCNNGKWLIPTASYQEHVSFANKVSVRTLNGFSSVGTTGTRIAEDRQLFDSYGNALISGTLDIFRQNTAKLANQSTEIFSISSISTESIRQTQVDMLTISSNKNVQSNDSFRAKNDETFVITVDQPFLIEKVAIEMPISLGKKWFDDKTAFQTLPYSALEDGVFKVGPGGQYNMMDEGGPGLTFALFCQKAYGAGTIRDLIGKTVLTHVDDTPSLVVTGTYGEQDIDGDSNVNNITCYLHGMPGNVSATTIAKGEDGLTFTGSIMLKITPSVTNGIKYFESSSFESNTKSNVINSVKQFLNSKNVDDYSIIGIDTFGRGSTGFAPSGGSIFGKEYTTADSQIVKNSFYLEEGTTKTNFLNDVDTNLTATSVLSKYKVKLFATSFVGGEKSSPYMINPGEKLVLSVSKTRPVHSFCNFDVKAATVPNAIKYGISSLVKENFEYSDKHDVTFQTGSINVTLYGSYVKSNNGVLL